MVYNFKKISQMKLFHFFTLVILFLFCFGCEGNDIQEKIISPVKFDGCKSLISSESINEVSFDKDCIQYQYNKEKSLSITHINAGMNCCPGNITAEINIEDNIITIIERETEHSCRCLCLYDLEYKITKLEEGEYKISIIESIINEDNKILEFDITLSFPTSGIFCVDRSNYPWGN